MITLEEAKSLSVGDRLYDATHRDSKCYPLEYRVNGRPKVWKTRPDEVKVPMKWGLKNYFYLTERDLQMVVKDPGELEIYYVIVRKSGKVEFKPQRPSNTNPQIRFVYGPYTAREAERWANHLNLTC